MRCVLFALAAFCLAGEAAASPTEPGRIEFEVLRNGQPFGRHVVSVSGTGDELRAQNQVVLRAGVGPVTVFRYEQSCAEIWRGGVLVGLDCVTLKEGRRTQVRAELREGRLRVAGAGEARFFPLGAFPTTWWTRPPRNADTLLDTETGAAMPVRVTRLGRETIEVGGQRVAADRIRVQGSLAVDLWYDTEGRWIGCAFTARGQEITYRLTSPLGEAPA